MAEDHAFHYDLNEEIRMKTLDAPEEGSEVIKGTVTDAEILERCKTYLTRKILGKAYKNARNIELEEKQDSIGRHMRLLSNAGDVSLSNMLILMNMNQLTRILAD